ncbi:Zinc finger protein 384 [Plakobranchus ocellatus]|uniref:Zinc finger protein 384 n=1 Tax=Plakobranchus ocellatus TaxID=259542 RepID=A0AAV4ATV7_9GAST|nr:Zinc finger protein 384 [Plakobranchus ocellatus]
MPPQNLSTPTSQEKSDHQQHQQFLQQHQHQLIHNQHMSQSLVEQAHGIHGAGGGGAMSEQTHGASHASLEHAHSMAEHAAHSMLDLSETGSSLEHLAGGGSGGASGGHSSGHTPQSLADLAHRRSDHNLDSASHREGLSGGTLSNDGGGAGGSSSGGGSGGGGRGSLTPTLNQMSQGDSRGDLPGLGGGAGGATTNGTALLSRPLSGLGGVSERQSLSQPMRNLTPVGGVDGRGDGGRVSVGLSGPGSGGGGGPSLQEHTSNSGSSGGHSSLNFSPDSQHHHQHSLPHQRIPIIPKRGRPPGSGSSQHSLGSLQHHRGPLSSSSSLHGHHHHSSHHQHTNQALHMRGLSDHQHHNSHHGSSISGDSSSHNGRVGGLYGLDGPSSGQQLNSRPGSVLMSEPSDSRDLGRGSHYSTSSSTGERNQSTSSSHSTALIEETIAAVASNLNRGSPNGGIMPGPLPPNSHSHHSNSLMGGLGGLLPPRSNSTLSGAGAGGDDSLADLVGRGNSHGIPMLSERASQSLSGLIDDGDGSHNQHHHSLHHQGHPSSSASGREIEKTHPCLTCLKMFRSKQQLAQHSLVHTGIRKHICTFCDRAFKQLSHLQQHVRIHTVSWTKHSIRPPSGPSLSEINGNHRQPGTRSRSAGQRIGLKGTSSGLTTRELPRLIEVFKINIFWCRYVVEIRILAGYRKAMPEPVLVEEGKGDYQLAR